MRRYYWLLLATLVAFGDCLRGSFHFDDYTLLTGSWANWGLLQTRPLTQFTFWLNYQLGGAEPFGYHAVNLLLHAAVVLLLFQLLQHSLPINGAFAAAALFAVHPIQSEAVAYIFARGTLLAAMFCLLSWRYWQRGKPWAAVLWFAVALLCKEECVTFPLFLLLVGPRLWKPAAAMLSLSLAAGLRTLYATKVLAGTGAGFSAGNSPGAYLAAQGFVIIRYCRLLLAPWGFTVDPDFSLQKWQEILAWAVLIAAAVWFRKRVWWLGGLILLIPSSSIFPAADLATDRRMYLPMLSFCALLPPLKRWMVAAGVIILAGLSIGRMEVWRTERSLWREAVEASPAKARPRIQLARAVPPQQALDVLNGAPDTGAVITERGRVYLELGRPAEALHQFGLALALHPGDAHAINNRGAALLALGQREAARKDFQRALSIDPNLLDAKTNLARIPIGPK